MDVMHLLILNAMLEMAPKDKGHSVEEITDFIYPASAITSDYGKTREQQALVIDALICLDDAGYIKLDENNDVSCIAEKGKSQMHGCCEEHCRQAISANIIYCNANAFSAILRHLARQ